MSNPQNIKKNMLMIWMVASLLWIPCASYMFRLDHIVYAHKQYDKFSYKVAQGRAKNPTRWAYHNRSFERAAKELRAANKDLGMFFLLGLGLPGIMLAVGTMLLENVDKPKRKKTK